VSIARRLRPPTGDAVLAVAVAALLVVGALATQRADPGEYDLTWWGATMLAGSGLALAWRRLWPLAVALVVGVLDVAYGVADQPDPPLQIATLVALYTVAAQCRRRTTVLIVVILPVGVMVAALLAGDSSLQDYYRAALPALGALLVGDQVRERSAAAEAERQHAAADAVVHERQRIARELHDVVAHHVSMVVVQAEAGAAGAEADGDDAAAMRFDGIADTGRVAMSELRRLLGVLREDTERQGTEPQPGIAAVPALVARVRAAGLPVDLVTEGEPRTLPDGIDVSAYRIVQEALTNVVRHAGSVPTTVRIGWSASAVELDVSDEGARTPDASDAHDGAAVDGGGGRGLVGIRERVALLGGSLRVGRRAAGGYEVVAHLPTPADGAP
jgi:signal transduction histidine kinase